MSDFGKELIRKARKDHVCSQCFLRIPKLYKYKYSSGLWDGSFYTDKQHVECHRSWVKLNSHSSGEMYDLYDFHGDGIDFEAHKREIKKVYSL